MGNIPGWNYYDAEPSDEELDDEYYSMHEDAGCDNPCGEEPFGCAGCAEFGTHGTTCERFALYDRFFHS